MHEQLRGKITIDLKVSLDSADKLSLYYTPGVAAVSSYLADHPEETRNYTWLSNNVAIISDGSAVLGLGDIGPYGALPVMEGKSMLFKQFADIDAIPLVLDVHSAEEIVAAVKAIAPSFGGINLEDIAAPICFEVEERLKRELPVPVFHDDQHGTAIVVLAGLINAASLTGRTLANCTVAVSGVGAAGVAIMKLLKRYAPSMRIVGVDSTGIITKNRGNLTPIKQILLDTNILADDMSGSMGDAIKDADIFIGVSKGGIVTKQMVRTMRKKPIVFALANPIPEISPDEAKSAGAAVIATGRSDFPNQVNNALCFPGIFRGALDNKVRDITEEHKLAAANAIAALVDIPSVEHIIPDVMDERLVAAIANVIR